MWLLSCNIGFVLHLSSIVMDSCRFVKDAVGMSADPVIGASKAVL